MSGVKKTVEGLGDVLIQGPTVCRLHEHVLTALEAQADKIREHQPWEGDLVVGGGDKITVKVRVIPNGERVTTKVIMPDTNFAAQGVWPAENSHLRVLS